MTLLGHAGRDPDVRTLPDGGKTASFSFAAARKWKREDGEAIESTEWHRIAVHGAAAKAAENMVRKGSAVLVEGRPAVRDVNRNRSCTCAPNNNEELGDDPSTRPPAAGDLNGLEHYPT